MSKDDLMSHWDEIVTDPRLTRERCESHLGALRDDAYLLEEYHVVTTGGSSGQRALVVFGWDEWARAHAAMARWAVRWLLRAWRFPPRAVASVATPSPTHVSGALGRTFASDFIPMHRFSVLEPLEEIVRGLNAAKPALLLAYPSILNLLAFEADAGRLRIAPGLVISGAEPLPPGLALRLKSIWGAATMNCYGVSEVGTVAHGCAFSAGMHLSEDLLIVEPVDPKGRPVGAGEQAAKLYVTPLYNRTLPLLRYEVTDRITLLPEEPCACGCAFRRIADVEGRQEDIFLYPGGVAVHPLAFAAPFGREPALIEYRVRQTPRGAEIEVKANGPLALEDLRRAILANLEGLALASPEVSIRIVDSIERVGIGKLKRFVPLPASR
jgi:phenylacetate-coenzyme A ligase PaaK-like adenylate-forming protein